jgi:AcrR family transcriptional regulator
VTAGANNEATLAARSVRAAHRHQQLLAAAARLMDRDGSEGVSMQAVAAEAGVSVGLIYRYFGGKDDLLLAVIVEVLDSFATRVPAAIQDAGEDHVHQLARAFRAYCEVIDEQRYAAVLTYRESKVLSAEGRNRIMELEVSTSEPLRRVLRDGVAAGVFAADVRDDVVAYDLLLLAHAWALKHWYFQRIMTFDDYIDSQFALVLRGILEPRLKRRYADLLAPSR